MDAEVSETSQQKQAFCKPQQIYQLNQGINLIQQPIVTEAQGHSDMESQNMTNRSSNQEEQHTHETKTLFRDSKQHENIQEYQKEYQMQSEHDTFEQNQEESLDFQDKIFDKQFKDFYLKHGSIRGKEVYDPYQTFSSSSNMKRSLLFTPRDIKSSTQYSYEIPPLLSTNQDSIYYTTNQSYSQNPTDLTLSQLASKSYFINSIMKKDSKELINQQKELEDSMLQQSQSQRSLVLNNSKKRQKQINSMGMKDNFLSIYEQSKPNKSNKNNKQLSIDNSNLQIGTIQMQSNNSSQEDLSEQKNQKLKILQDKSRKKSLLIQLTPILEKGSQQKKIFNSFSNKQDIFQQKQITPQNELSNSEKIPLPNKFFQKERSQFPQVSQYFQNQNNFSADQKKQTKLLYQSNNSSMKKLNNHKNLSQNQLLNNNNVQQNKHLKTESSVQKLNKLKDVLQTNNTNQKLLKQIYFSKTENSDNSIDNVDKVLFTENQNNISFMKSQLLQRDIYSQKETQFRNKSIDQNKFDHQENKETTHFRIKKEQKNALKQKQTEIQIPNKPTIFEINKHQDLVNDQKLHINLSQNEQIQLFQKEQSYFQDVYDRSNLSTPQSNHLKINQGEEGKWKIENSDNVDMEASRSSSVNQNKNNLGKQSSQQLSPSIFSLNTNNLLIYQNMQDNSSNNVMETNKQISITKKRSISDNSLDNIKKQSSIELNQIKSNEEIKIQSNKKIDSNSKEDQITSIQQINKSLYEIPQNNTSTSIVSQKNIPNNTNSQNNQKKLSSETLNEFPSNKVSSLKNIDVSYERSNQNGQLLEQKIQQQKNQIQDNSTNTQISNKKINQKFENQENNNQEQNSFKRENDSIKIVVKVIESKPMKNEDQQKQNKNEFQDNYGNTKLNNNRPPFQDNSRIASKQNDQANNEKIDVSMTTVYEKSEVTSNKSINLNQSDSINVKIKNSNLNNLQNSDISQEINQQQIKSNNEDNSFQSAQKITISSQSEIKDIKLEGEEITSSNSIDTNLNQNQIKQQNPDLVIQLNSYESQKNLLPQQFSQNSIKINLDQNDNQQSDKTVRINQSDQLIVEKDKQSFRMRSETFKDREKSELHINVMPPDNTTPQSIKNKLEIHNFSQISKEIGNVVETQNETNQNNNQIQQNIDKSEIEINQFQTQIDRCKQQSQEVSLQNLDDLSQGESKKNITSITNIYISQINEQDNKIDSKNKLSQQLNIQNNNTYQKLNRFIKSSDDQVENNQFWEENEKKTETQSNTTKHSFKKNNFNNDSQHSSFLLEQDSPAISLKKQLQSRNLKQGQNNVSIQSEEFQKIQQRSSIEQNGSRRSSLLTPQQIKQAKKESRFYPRLSNFNQSFFEAEDSMILSIYGQETDKQIQLNGLCQFSENSKSNQGQRNDQDNSSNNGTVGASENDNQSQNPLQNSQSRETNFKKLINQIDYMQQNPYLESFDSNKGNNNMFQKNVKTLFRKVNQYFKTKYHQENFGMDGSKTSDNKSGQQEGSQTKIAQQIPRISLQNGFAITSEKLIQKGKKSIQSENGQSEDLEQEQKIINQNISNIELQKSDIEKLNQRLSRNSKVSDKFQKQDEVHSQKDVMAGIEKQSTLERANGFVRNIKKKQSQKLVIQINPPSDEPTQIQVPHIKLDFSAIKKKNGNTEFVLNQNAREVQSLDSSNEDEEDFEDLRNDHQLPISQGNQNEYQENHSSYILDFLNQSNHSWDDSDFNSQFVSSELNQNKFFNKMSKMSIKKIDRDRNHKMSLINGEQQQEIKSSTLRFLEQNSWRFVKNYQIAYLEKQIDKDFFYKVSRLRNVLKNIKSKVDPSDRFKLDTIIALNQTNINAGEIFLARDRTESKASKVVQQSFFLNDSRENQSYDLSNKDIYEHQFLEELVNEGFYDEKKRNKEECSQESSSDDSFSSESSDEIEDIEMEEQNLISDQDKDLADRYQFIYDEEDYEGGRSSYQLNEGYLEPVVTNESSNMFTQLYEEITPVLSGVENDQINDILKTRKNDKKAHYEIVQQNQLEKKFKTINKMVAQLDIKSSQTDMRNIQNEYNELLEGDFQDNQRIDHDFFKKDFVKQQQNQFNKFNNNQKYLRGKQMQNYNKRSNLDNSVVGIGSCTHVPPYQRQTLKERSPQSIDNNIEMTTMNKYKRQDSKNSQHQNFQHSFNLYNQQQQPPSTLSTQPQSLKPQQQSQQQMQIQPHLIQHQYNTLQQNTSSQPNNFIQNNTLPANQVQYNPASPSNLLVNLQNTPQNQIPKDIKVYAGAFMSNMKNKQFTQSLKNFSSITNRGETNVRNQITIKNEDDLKALKNSSKISSLQQQKPEMYPSYSSIQSNYNQASTLQSQQSAFNQSDSLRNKEILNQENNKQGGIKNQDNQVYSLQKVNTNQSTEDNQLAAPSPTQIAKKDLRSTQRKRSIFNIENSQSQPNIALDQNKNQNPQPQLQSPVFANNQNQANLYYAQRASYSIKPNNYFQSPQNINNLKPQLVLSHQASLIQKQNASLNQSQNQTYYTNLQQQQQLQQQQLQQQQQQRYQNSQILIPLQHLQQNDIVQSPYRQTGTLQSYGSLNSQNNQNGNQVYMQSQLLNQINTPTNNQLSSMQAAAAAKAQMNSFSVQYNLNQSTIQAQINNSRQNSNINNTELLNSQKPGLLSSFSVKKDIEKATSMDRQNLVMRTKLQQTIKKNQQSQKDQVFSAIKENNIHEIEDLLNQYHSLSLESRDEEGNTFIIIAAQVGSKEIVEYLFQKGADINASNNDGDTALHKANFYKYHNVADFLIQKGAMQNKANNIGLNPWASYNQPRR